MIRLSPPPMTQSRLLLVVVLFLILFGNLRFFRNVIETYPANLANLPFLLSLVVVFGAATLLLLSLVAWGRLLRPLLILVLLVSSQAAYFMDTYNVILDDTMIDNILNTDLHETLDLFSVWQLVYLLLLGVLPAWWVWRVPAVMETVSRAMMSRLRYLGTTLGLAIGLVLLQGSHYASFFREHKPLRFYSNPGYYLYSLGKQVGGAFRAERGPVAQLALDAHIQEHDELRELVILVLGETARADHFSLNGYARQTNPLLAQEDVISYDNVWSCGTSTAWSVPCIFSIYDRDGFDPDRGEQTENLLDVLKRTGVNVLWLDNNSSSKGVADRVEYQSYRTPEVNPVCDLECRDEGMLTRLQDYIDSHPSGDIFIVLHQMGNHGPAYSKRYPEAFARFQPVCETNQLEECSSDQIINAYDNALVYTDSFLKRTIDLLRDNAGFESAMLYVSDHGESLGESGVYLHGLPYILAPEDQKRVPLILWANEAMQHDFDLAQARAMRQQPYSHDNLFHTVLGLFEVRSEVYRADLDMLVHLLDD